MPNQPDPESHSLPLPRALTVALDTEVTAEVQVHVVSDRSTVVVFGSDLGAVRLVGPLAELRRLVDQAATELAAVADTTA